MSLKGVSSLLGSLTRYRLCGTAINKPYTVLNVMFYYDDGVSVYLMLYILLLILAARLHDHYFSQVALPYQKLLWISYIFGIGSCLSYFWLCDIVRALVCVIAASTVTDLTYSRRPIEFERESGNSGKQRALGVTTDLVHGLRGNMVGTDSAIHFFARLNL